MSSVIQWQQMIKVPIDIIDNWIVRYTSKVYNNGYCWVWQGSTNNGYGVFGIDHKMYYAHRIALAIDGRHEDKPVDHRCRNQLCVNPDHLEYVSYSTNTKRGLVSKRGRKKFTKTHCANGHEYTGANTYMYWHPTHAPTGKRECRTCKDANRYKSRIAKTNVKH